MLRTSVTSCIIHEIDFLPHLESFMCKQKFENKFFKKYPIQPPNGELPICRLPFPNGSYHNGVYRTFCALFVQFTSILLDRMANKCKHLSLAVWFVVSIFRWKIKGVKCFSATNFGFFLIFFGRLMIRKATIYTLRKL